MDIETIDFQKMSLYDCGYIWRTFAYKIFKDIQETFFKFILYRIGLYTKIYI